MNRSLVGRISAGEVDVQAAVKALCKRPDAIPDVISGMTDQKGTGKFACAKTIMLLSEERPELVYPHFGEIRKLLGSENRIVQWSAIRIIANLASVDRSGKIDRIIDKYLGLIGGSVMITAANTIAGAALIAAAKPRLADKIVTGILRVERAKYKTDECRNVAIGDALTAFEQMPDVVCGRKDVLRFARKQTNNTRNSTKKKAEALLKKLGKS